MTAANATAPQTRASSLEQNKTPEPVEGAGAAEQDGATPQRRRIVRGGAAAPTSDRQTELPHTAATAAPAPEEAAAEPAQAQASAPAEPAPASITGRPRRGRPPKTPPSAEAAAPLDPRLAQVGKLVVYADACGLELRAFVAELDTLIQAYYELLNR